MTRRPDKQAAKTTIVGGQPPGNARDLPPIPAGLEELLGMAAVEQGFADVLLSSDRQRAIDVSGVSLTSTERTILSSVKEDALRQMVSRLALTEQDRRYFLSRAAAALVALVGGGAAVAATGCRQRVADPPGPVQTAPEIQVAPDSAVRTRPSELEVETGARPDRPDEETKRPDRPAPPTGIQPDRPKPKPKPKPKPQPQGIRPDRPPKTKGIRPDRPPRTRGIRPDRPKTGIRPDRPETILNPFGDADDDNEKR